VDSPADPDASQNFSPWRRTSAHRAPGGSSSGAGVSLLEGSALLAFGSDTAGSVRIPACMTGTVGLKVTLGRWPADGVVPLSSTFDTPGLLARSVCDVAYGFAALDPAGIDPVGFIARAGTRDLAGVRIGVGDPFLWRDCDPGIAETAHEAVNALVRAGAVTREFMLPEAEAAYTLFFKAVSAPSSCAASSTGNCRTGWRSLIRSSLRRCAMLRA